MVTTSNTTATDLHAHQSADGFDTPAGQRVSWGAIIAGFALFFALTWLLLTLGAALGVGIADATDLDAVGNGLGIGAIVWLLVTSLFATFAGALLAAKLSGNSDDAVGGLHGLTVWAVCTLAIVLLGASGIGGAISSVSGAISSSAKATQKVVVNSAGGGEDSSSMLPESVTNSVSAALKRQASKLISETATGSSSPDQQEVRSAMDSLSSEDNAAISSALISGNTDEARKQLSDRTDLSDDEITSIVEGAGQQMEEWKDSAAAKKAEQWLDQQMTDVRNAASESISDLGGAEVSQQEVKQAIRNMDADTVASTARYLIMGKPQQAKDVLVAQTNLQEADINAIVDGAEKEVQAQIDEAKAEVSKVTEKVGDYTQAVLWVAFLASALGLLAGIFGGSMGAGTVRKARGLTVHAR